MISDGSCDTEDWKNKYIKMYLKYIYFMLSIHLHRGGQSTQKLYFSKSKSTNPIPKKFFTNLQIS